MEKKDFTIGVLAITAALLLLANLMPTPTIAAEAVKDRDYQAVTARIQAGGEGLYITDNRTGQIAVFSFDPATRRLVPRRVGSLTDVFPPK